jgi:hypothetical protein
LRLRLSGADSRRELLGRISDSVRGASGHQDLPFDRVVAQVRPDRDGVQQFLSVMFNCYMALWGGFARRATGMIGFGLPAEAGMITAGPYPAALFPIIGMTVAGASDTLLNGHWQTLIQNKVGLELQGVFGIEPVEGWFCCWWCSVWHRSASPCEGTLSTRLRRALPNAVRRPPGDAGQVIAVPSPNRMNRTPAAVSAIGLRRA